jgi:hypothetical protein
MHERGRRNHPRVPGSGRRRRGQRVRRTCHRHLAGAGVRSASGRGQVVDNFLDSVEAEGPLNNAAVRDLIAKDWR